ncbi:hypothetical protein E2C01_059117 [Portunus trituberculatus]|uniref:Uncharacterized protein n=1 Tax=Portunus trituberculatus TaxID=210409 RepID=A0A5B7H874_PORTR|nr:hypothetical protein [Portunus trituberculatus]
MQEKTRKRLRTPGLVTGGFVIL